MKKISLLFIIGLMIPSCIDEYYFGKSSEKMILSFTLEGQVGNSVLNQDSLKIRVHVGSGTDISSVKPKTVTLSTFASISPSPDQSLDYTSGHAVYNVTAEDGSSQDYTVYVFKEGSNPQLENSGFDEWYTTPSGYKEPGMDENSIWATGNQGVVTLKDPNTTPLEINDGNFAARMETLDMGAISGLVGQRVGAGSIFTGTFKLDLSDPVNSAKFGVAFQARPTGFSIDYAYIPGDVYMDGGGNILDKEDACDIYMLLENRSGPEVKRIATGWFRSGEKVSDAFKDIHVELLYGDLPAEIPDFQRPSNGWYGTPDDEVTHIVFICTSSYNGNQMEGGIGSILVVDNLELSY